MNKRFKDDNNEHSGDNPIITLDQDAAVSKSQGGPMPLTVEETVEVLSELDRLNEQVQELTKTVQYKDREIERLKDAATIDDEEKIVPPKDAVASNDSTPEGKDKEIAELKDKYLRTLAEAENTRRRIRQQSEDSVRVQRENLLRDLLPIVDNLERAVSAAKANGGGNGKSIVQGVEMVLASLLDFLKNHGVRPQTSVGQAFDPTRHEAADHVANDKHPPNTVVEEFHRGYMIGDRVLRPARVSVAKGAGDKPSAQK